MKLVVVCFILFLLFQKSIHAYELNIEGQSFQIYPSDPFASIVHLKFKDQSHDTEIIKSVRDIFESLRDNDQKKFLDTYLDVNNLPWALIKKDEYERFKSTYDHDFKKNIENFNDIIKIAKVADIDLNKLDLIGIRRTPILYDIFGRWVQNIIMIVKKRESNTSYFIDLNSFEMDKKGNWKRSQANLRFTEVYNLDLDSIFSGFGEISRSLFSTFEYSFDRDEEAKMKKECENKILQSCINYGDFLLGDSNYVKINEKVQNYYYPHLSIYFYEKSCKGGITIGCEKLNKQLSIMEQLCETQKEQETCKYLVGFLRYRPNNTEKVLKYLAPLCLNGDYNSCRDLVKINDNIEKENQREKERKIEYQANIEKKEKEKLEFDKIREECKLSIDACTKIGKYFEEIGQPENAKRFSEPNFIKMFHNSLNSKFDETQAKPVKSKKYKRNLMLSATTKIVIIDNTSVIKFNQQLSDYIDLDESALFKVYLDKYNHICIFPDHDLEGFKKINERHKPRDIKKVEIKKFGDVKGFVIPESFIKVLSIGPDTLLTYTSFWQNICISTQ